MRPRLIGLPALLIVLPLLALVAAAPVGGWWKVTHLNAHNREKRIPLAVDANFVVSVKRGWDWAADVAPFIVAVESHANASCIVKRVTQTSRRTLVALDCLSEPSLSSVSQLKAVIVSCLANAKDASKMILAPNGVYRTSERLQVFPGTQTGAPWHLQRLDTRPDILDGNYDYLGRGAGIQTFILDTGTTPTHADFACNGLVGCSTTRVTALANTIDDSGNLDGNGHGTHVTGLTVGITYGVAKQAYLSAIKVLNDAGEGMGISSPPPSIPCSFLLCMGRPRERHLQYHRVNLPLRKRRLGGRRDQHH